MDPLIEQAVKGVVLPAAVAVVGVCISKFATGKKWAPFMMAMTVGIPYMTVHMAIHPLTTFPPRDSIDWMPLVALIAIVAAGIAGYYPQARLLLAVAAIVPAVLLPSLPLFRSGPGAPAFLAVVASALLLLGSWISCRSNDESHSSTSMALALLVISSGTAVLLGISGSALLAQLAGAVATTLGVLFVATLVFRQFPPLRGMYYVCVALIGGLVLYGDHFASVPLASAALIALSFATFWVTRIPIRQPFVRTMIPAMIAAVPVAIAVAIAILRSPPLEY